MPLTKYITDENGQPPSRNMWLKLQSEKFILALWLLKKTYFVHLQFLKPSLGFLGGNAFFKIRI